MNDAKVLLAGAHSFFSGLKHRGEPVREGLGEEHFVEDWRDEHKRAFMYSGCKDDQTSADADISGEACWGDELGFLDDDASGGKSKLFAGESSIGVFFPGILLFFGEEGKGIHG